MKLHEEKKSPKRETTHATQRRYLKMGWDGVGGPRDGDRT